MPERVLITGAAGFIGSHMVDVFARNTDWDIVAMEGLTYAADVARLSQLNLARGRVRTVFHDLRAPVPDRVKMEIGDVNYVVNVASESHVDRSIEAPAAFILNNVALCCHMLDYARCVSPEVFVQISTDEVYGPAAEPLKHHEWSLHLPSNPYAASKAAQEDIAYSYWRTYNVPVLITNTMNNFGPRQHPEKFLPKAVRCILNGWGIDVHADLSGPKVRPGSRHWLHARTHAEAVLFLLRNVDIRSYRNGGTGPERFNIVGPIELDNLEIVQRAAEVLRRPALTRFVDFHQSRPGHDRRYALDGGKLFRAGFVPSQTFSEDFTEAVRWIADHPEWLK